MIIETQKDAQRRAGKAARRALPPAQRAAANAALCAALLADFSLSRAKTILVYHACAAEADCAAFCKAAAARGVRLAYPRCDAPGQMEAFLPGPAAVWTPDIYGIPSPCPESSTCLAPAELDAVLVPLAAFDAACRRIGMGGGVYDRYLPRCTQALQYGIAFSVQQVKAAAQVVTDVSLDAVFTEKQAFFRFACGAKPNAL